MIEFELVDGLKSDGLCNEPLYTIKDNYGQTMTLDTHLLSKMIRAGHIKLKGYHSGCDDVIYPEDVVLKGKGKPLGLSKTKGMICGAVLGDALGHFFDEHHDDITEFDTPEKIRSLIYEHSRGLDWTYRSTNLLAAINCAINSESNQINPVKFVKELYKSYKLGLWCNTKKMIGLSESAEDAIKWYGLHSDILKNKNFSDEESIEGMVRAIAVVSSNTSDDLAMLTYATNRNDKTILCYVLYFKLINKVYCGKEITVEDLHNLANNRDTKSGVCEILYNTIRIIIETGSFEEALIRALHMNTCRADYGILVGALAGAYYGFKEVDETYMMDHVAMANVVMAAAIKLYSNGYGRYNPSVFGNSNEEEI